MADEKKKSERDHLNDMLIEWAPIIGMHFKRLSKNLPPHVDAQDLYAAGMQGLYHAFHKYNPDKGASFKTYASNRIEKKMRDHISNGGPNAVDKYHYTAAKKFLSQNPAPQEGSDYQELKPDTTQPATAEPKTAEPKTSQPEAPKVPKPQKP